VEKRGGANSANKKHVRGPFLAFAGGKNAHQKGKKAPFFFSGGGEKGLTMSLQHKKKRRRIKHRKEGKPALGPLEQGREGRAGPVRPPKRGGGKKRVEIGRKRDSRSSPLCAGDARERRMGRCEGQGPDQGKKKRHASGKKKKNLNSKTDGKAQAG